MVLLNPAALPPAVTVLIHPVDTGKHPTIPPGWRWAVMIGNRPPNDLDACANAGWEPDERSAAVAGEEVGAAACKALRMCGLPASYRVLTLPADPIDAGNDKITVMG